MRYITLMRHYFIKSGPKLLTTHHIVRLSKCALRDISFDMITVELQWLEH